MICVFLKKIIIFSVSVCIISVLLFVISKTLYEKYRSTDFSASVIDKYENINSTGEDRIILMGGSNVSFSINSALIEKETKKNVINSASVFNSGYVYQINFLKKFAREKDIIIYIPEFGCYSGKGAYGQEFLYKCIMFEKNVLKVCGLENLRRYFINANRFHIKSIYDILKFRTKVDSELSIDRFSGFNHYGDIIKHLSEKPKLSKIRSFDTVNSLKMSNDFLNLLLETKNYFDLKKINFIVMFPPYSKNFVTENLLNETRDLVSEFDFIQGDLSNNLFEDHFFYDSPYHTLKKAREIRTQNLINILKLN